MGETMTLWQRCEALGQFEDFKDDHVEMLFASGRWVIRHDGQCILFIYEDKVRGSEWLADAILCHIERIRFLMPTIGPLNEMCDDEKAAFMKAMSELACGPMTFAPNESVVTMQNINEKLREALPKPSEYPTPQQCKDLFVWIIDNHDKLKLRGFENRGHSESREITVERPNDPRRGFSVTSKSFYGYHKEGNGKQLTFDEACEWVEFFPELPNPESLPGVTYVVEAPQDLVSIPRDQWTELQTAFKTMAKVLCFEIKDIEVEQ